MSPRARTAAPAQNRVQPGVPTGGEFTFTPRAEADVRLDVHPTVARTETPLTDAELAAQSLLSARHWVYSRGLKFTSAEDIAQSTVETVLRARMNDERVVITERYVHTVAHGHVAIALRGVLRNEDRKAKAIYDRRIAETQAETGTVLTPAEKAQIAVDVRETWPDPRHKPSAKFVELAEMRFVSLDAPVGASEDRLIDHIASTRGYNTDDLSVEPDSTPGRVLTMVENKQRSQARREAWNAIAELSDAPAAVEAVMSSDKAAGHRRTMTAAGGVAAAIRDWDEGATTAATEALFAPFGDLDEAQRDDVCGLLRRLHANADDLYDSALRYSTRVRKAPAASARP